MSDSCDRRTFLRSLAGGSLLLPGLLHPLLADDARQDPLAPKRSHFPGKAKQVIFLFSTGGVSHMDTFDYKKTLLEMDGKSMVPGGGLSRDKKKLLRPQWTFRPGGKCGTMVSDLFPHLREQMDEVALINSMKSDDNEHFQATLAMHTGSFFTARPSMGSWVSYGLGTMNQNLPSFVVIAPNLPYAGTQVFANDFLPAYHQGTRVVPGPEPIPDLTRRSRVAGLQEAELGLAGAFDKQYLKDNGNDSELAARIQSFETAFRMQTEAPEAFDLSKESDETLKMYGLDRAKPQGYAWQCLVARRLIERGVRFVELIDTGASGNWDAHGNIKGYDGLAKNIDRPIAGLIRDLKRRGMLDETLIVWTTEFGRTPGEDGPGGRGHHGAVFSSWLAGGGVKGGQVYGKSDDIGSRVEENQVHVHDFHATILHLLGFDHTKLTYRHAGRDFRLTDVHGTVVKELLA
ncbi:MAG TPA: DUF1501 domain-containing protein [Planctomycetota bacterium]|nr:DUF1501 domain-containing protein [Planctomycetota bacterium]